MSIQNNHTSPYTGVVKETLRCPLCFMCLYEPVSLTCCGNSFCRDCILRVYDGCNGYIPPCPICREVLPFQKEIKINRVLWELIQILVPVSKQIQRANMENIIIRDFPSESLYTSQGGQQNEMNPQDPQNMHSTRNIDNSTDYNKSWQCQRDETIHQHWHNDLSIQENSNIPTLMTSYKTKENIIIPLFGLDSIVYPGSPLPLHVFEPRYRLMIRRCLKGSKRFGIANISRIAHGEIVGTLCHIEKTAVFDDGRLLLMTHGEKRFKINPESLHTQDGYYCASVSWIDDDMPDSSTMTQCVHISRFLHITMTKYLSSLSTNCPSIVDVVKNKFGDMPGATEIQAMSFWCSSFLIGQMSRDTALGVLSTTSLLDRLKTLEGIAAECFQKVDTPQALHLRNQMTAQAQQGV